MRQLILLTALLGTACSRSPTKHVTSPCLIPAVGREARCLTIEVPENPDVPTGRKIAIRAAVVPALGLRSLPDPVFVFAGGPGQAASEVADMAMYVLADLEARRDVVLVDQRGTGHSTPLRCPDDDARLPLAERFDETANLRRLEACRQQLLDAGQDLAQFATWVAVRDVEAVRQALGYGPVNLWGASYGTRAALEYARQFPASVRSLVLDGVVPPSLILPLDVGPDTEAALNAWVARANAGPALATFLNADAGPVQALDPVTGQSAWVPLTAGQRFSLVRAPLYVPTLAAAWPTAVSQAAAGDATALLGLASATDGQMSMGMHLSVVCAEDVPRLTPELIEIQPPTRAGRDSIQQYQAMCGDWPTRAVPPEFFALPKVTAPVLLLSGGLDPATPPRHAASLASALPHATHLVAPQLGHGVSTTACGPKVVSRFIQDGDASRLDASCLSTIPAPALFRAVVSP